MNRSVIQEELVTSIEETPALVDELSKQLNALVSEGFLDEIDNVFLIGAGDGHAAALSARMAFAHFSSYECRVYSAENFMHQFQDRAADRTMEKSLVVLSSYSGKTKAILQASQVAREAQAKVLLITANDEAVALPTVDACLCYHLRDKRPSPGIRSYHAALVALYLLASTFSDAREAVEETAASIREIGKLHAQHGSALSGQAEQLALELDGHEVIMVLESESFLGTAKYTAAKILEATGVTALAVSFESWMHVERFSSSHGMPLLIIASPTQTELTGRILELATKLGKNFFLIANADPRHEAEAARKITLPVGVEPVFHPFLCVALMTSIVFHLAEVRGATPFTSNPVNMVK